MFALIFDLNVNPGNLLTLANVLISATALIIS